MARRIPVSTLAIATGFNTRTIRTLTLVGVLVILNVDGFDGNARVHIERLLLGLQLLGEGASRLNITVML